MTTAALTTASAAQTALDLADIRDHLSIFIPVKDLCSCTLVSRAWYTTFHPALFQFWSLGWSPRPNRYDHSAAPKRSISYMDQKKIEEDQVERLAELLGFVEQQDDKGDKGKRGDGERGHVDKRTMRRSYLRHLRISSVLGRRIFAAAVEMALENINKTKDAPCIDATIPDPTRTMAATTLASKPESIYFLNLQTFEFDQQHPKRHGNQLGPKAVEQWLLENMFPYTRKLTRICIGTGGSWLPLTYQFMPLTTRLIDQGFATMTRLRVLELDGERLDLVAVLYLLEKCQQLKKLVIRGSRLREEWEMNMEDGAGIRGRNHKPATAATNITTTTTTQAAKPSAVSGTIIKPWKNNSIQILEIDSLYEPVMFRSILHILSVCTNVSELTIQAKALPVSTRKVDGELGRYKLNLSNLESFTFMCKNWVGTRQLKFLLSHIVDGSLSLSPLQQRPLQQQQQQRPAILKKLCMKGCKAFSREMLDIILDCPSPLTKKSLFEFSSSVSPTSTSQQQDRVGQYSQRVQLEYFDVTGTGLQSGDLSHILYSCPSLRTLEASDIRFQYKDILQAEKHPWVCEKSLERFSTLIVGLGHAPLSELLGRLFPRDVGTTGSAGAEGGKPVEDLKETPEGSSKEILPNSLSKVATGKAGTKAETTFNPADWVTMCRLPVLGRGSRKSRLLSRAKRMAINKSCFATILKKREQKKLWVRKKSPPRKFYTANARMSARITRLTINDPGRSLEFEKSVVGMEVFDLEKKAIESLAKERSDDKELESKLKMLRAKLEQAKKGLDNQRSAMEVDDAYSTVAPPPLFVFGLSSGEVFVDHDNNRSGSNMDSIPQDNSTSANANTTTDNHKLNSQDKKFGFDPEIRLSDYYANAGLSFINIREQQLIIHGAKTGKLKVTMKKSDLQKDSKGVTKEAAKVGMDYYMFTGPENKVKKIEIDDGNIFDLNEDHVDFDDKEFQSAVDAVKILLGMKSNVGVSSNSVDNLIDANNNDNKDKSSPDDSTTTIITDEEKSTDIQYDKKYSGIEPRVPMTKTLHQEILFRQNLMAMYASQDVCKIFGRLSQLSCLSLSMERRMEGSFAQRGRKYDGEYQLLLGWHSGALKYLEDCRDMRVFKVGWKDEHEIGEIEEEWMRKVWPRFEGIV